MTRPILFLAVLSAIACQHAQVTQRISDELFPVEDFPVEYDRHAASELGRSYSIRAEHTNSLAACRSSNTEARRN